MEIPILIETSEPKKSLTTLKTKKNLHIQDTLSMKIASATGHRHQIPKFERNNITKNVIKPPQEVFFSISRIFPKQIKLLEKYLGTLNYRIVNFASIDTKK